VLLLLLLVQRSSGRSCHSRIQRCDLPASCLAAACTVITPYRAHPAVQATTPQQQLLLLLAQLLLAQLLLRTLQLILLLQLDSGSSSCSSAALKCKQCNTPARAIP
jgi:hypothetical protein